MALHPPVRIGSPGTAFLWLASLLSAVSLPLALLPGGARAEQLYSLVTQCSVNRAAAVPCTVEAVSEAGATIYRHRIGSTTETLRITDAPSSMSLWNAAARSWQPLRNAAVLFSSNTLCINSRALCVVNPNYLNSLLQQRPDFRGRDLIQVRFASTGRVELTCYDQGCALVGTVMEAS